MYPLMFDSFFHHLSIVQLARKEEGAFHELFETGHSKVDKEELLELFQTVGLNDLRVHSNFYPSIDIFSHIMGIKIFTSDCCSSMFAYF